MWWKTGAVLTYNRPPSDLRSFFEVEEWYSYYQKSVSYTKPKRTMDHSRDGGFL